MTGTEIGAAIRDAIKALLGLVEPPSKPRRTMMFLMKPPVPKDQP